VNRDFRHHASLVLNVVLAITAVVLALHKSERPPAPSAREVNPETLTNRTPVFSNQPKSPQNTNFTSASDRRRWLVDQLRAAGVSNDVLARFVKSDLDAGWEHLFRETAERTRGNSDSNAVLQLDQERDEDAQMRAALGEEGYKQWDQKNMLLQAFGVIGSKLPIQLTASEADALYDMKKKMQQQRWDLEQARLNGKIDEAEASDANSKAYIELTQQMKTLLGDERYAKSQGLDADATAANLRQDMAKVNPSDTQFQDLLKAQRQWTEQQAALDEKIQQDPSQAATYEDQRKALEQARDEEYKRVLGANVFDTLQKEQDDNYLKMKKCEDIWGLDDNKIDYVYGSIKYYEKSVEDYRAQARALEAQGQSVDWDAVNRNLQQFADQTRQELQDYLGQDRFNKMQRNGIFQFNQTQMPHSGPP
jgi:hypothetical protein